MLGIALGVAALIIVLSVMNGFQKEVRDRMLSVIAHVELYERWGGALPDWTQLAAQARQHPEVVGAAPFVPAQALIARGEDMRGAMVRGIEPVAEATVTPLAASMKDTFARLKSGEWGVLIGVELANALGVREGDALTLVAPSGQVTPAGVVPRLKQVTVAGVFEVTKPFYSLDTGRVFRQLGDVRHRGAEFSLSGQIAPGLTAIAGTALIDAKLSGDAVDSGLVGRKPLASFGRLSTAVLDYRPTFAPAVSVDLVVESTSDRVACLTTSAMRHACSSRAGGWCTPPAACCRQRTKRLPRPFQRSTRTLSPCRWQACWPWLRCLRQTACARARMANGSVCGHIGMQRMAFLLPSGGKSPERPANELFRLSRSPTGSCPAIVD